MWKHINMFTVIEKDLLTITFCELLKALFNESQKKNFKGIEIRQNLKLFKKFF